MEHPEESTPAAEHSTSPTLVYRLLFSLLWCSSLALLTYVSYVPLGFLYLVAAQLRANTFGPPEQVVNDPEAIPIILALGLMYFALICLPILYLLNHVVGKKMLPSLPRAVLWAVSIVVLFSPFIIYMLRNWF